MPNNTRLKPDPHGGGDRVVALLNQLGDRLIRGERERVSVRSALDRFEKIFSELEDKAANGERAFLTLQDKISKNETVDREIREQQDRIEQEQKRQAERLDRAALLVEKMEEALAMQARMNRRLEKMTQDRVRLIHKLERIEETVAETRNALNSKALVLLADRGVARDTDAPQLPAGIAARPRPRAAASPLWQSPGAARAAIAAMVALPVLIGVVLGVQLLSRDSGVPERAEPVKMASGGPVTRFTSDEDDAAAALADAGPPQPQPLPPGKNDIMSAGDDALLARLEDDPDALAADLNRIEPSAADPEASAEADAVSPVPPPPASKMTAARDGEEIRAFLEAQKTDGPLNGRIKPDDALPPVVKEIEKKAFEGVPEAQHDLAAIYTAGHGGVKSDYARAAAWFREAALGGVANARYNLGVLYHQGLGVKQDIGTAIGWYRSAAAMNHPEAQYNLGIACIEGVGADYDPRRAAENFEKAANGGVTEAAYNLGLIHENGLLGERRTDEALYWYRQAAAKGSAEADTALRQLAKTMSITMDDVDAIVAKRVARQKPVPAPAQEIPVQKNEARAEPAAVVEEQEPVQQRRVVSAAPVPAPQNQAVIAQIQDQLMKMGLYPGPADGVDGPVTEDAIRAYQAMNDLQADGKASEALLVHMMTREESGAANVPQASAAPSSLLPEDGESGSRTE